MDSGDSSVPLTPFQQGVARLLSQTRTPDSFLAGGAALHLEPNSLRYSNDLDYFNDSAERVASAFATDLVVLEQAGYNVETKLDRPGFVRAIVSRTDESTKVEWVHDTAWRFLPAVQNDVVGFTLHPLDLAINKLLALVGRDEPRDFLDAILVHQQTLCLGAMVWAATAKDPGFTPPMLLGMLRRRGRFHPEDFARLALRAEPNLVELKCTWLDALASAEAFISSRPKTELGCLYYSRKRQMFPRDPANAEDIVPHYGRPGGVLPMVG